MEQLQLAVCRPNLQICIPGRPGPGPLEYDIQQTPAAAFPLRHYAEVLSSLVALQLSTLKRILS